MTINILKSSSRFLSLFFSLKKLLLVPIGTSRNDFEFFQLFVELFVFVFDSSVMNTQESQLETLGEAIFSNINYVSPSS
jgi:hypothetical protein